MKRMFLQSRVAWAFLGAACVAVGSGQAAEAANIVTLADSEQDYSGMQGQNPGEWQYGYYATPGDSSSFMQLPDYEPTQFDGNVWGGQQGNSVYDSPWMSSVQASPYNDNGNFLWPVRRWTSNYSGLVTIEGDYQDVNNDGLDPSRYDGTLGLILINGINAATPANPIEVNDPNLPGPVQFPLTAGAPAGIPSNALLSNTLFPSGTDPLTYSWQGNINTGDTVDFAVSHDIFFDLRGTLIGAFLPPANANHDSTLFTAVIQGQEPAVTPSTAVPTPAMLPGLIGLGANLLRKKRRQQAQLG